METGLSGKTFVVTGASGGIGSATARILGKEGCNVAVHYNTNRKGAEKTAADVEARGGRAMLVRADLSQEDEVVAMFDQVTARFPIVDGLVNNAGIWPSADVALRDMSTERFVGTFQINLLSVFFCNRAFLRHLSKSGARSASIVMVSSTAAVFGEAGHADYSCSKAAMDGMNLTLKNEICAISPFGRCNVVSPGWTLTPMAEVGLSSKPVAVTKALQTVPMRKFACPEDVARAIVYLSSDRLAGHVTGQNIVVAGGME
ncbi:3-oxoacyl-[acyl-carrier protein] reductase, partial [Diplonema papillatum]